MHSIEKATTKNALTAIVLYELSRLETLPFELQLEAATGLISAIQTLRMSQTHANASFHESQAAYYASQKRDALDKRIQAANQVEYTIASVMHSIYKAYEIEGLQNELIATTINWTRKTVSN